MRDCPQNPGPASRGSERRAHERRPASEFPHLSARLVGGPDVRLLDLSTRGVLLETASRLGPGTSVVLRFVASDTELTLRGCVVRSSVGQLSGNQLRYHTALNFAEDLTILDAADPPREKPERPHLHLVAPTAPSAAASEPVPRLGGVLELVATVNHSGTELRNMLAVNDW